MVKSGFWPPTLLLPLADGEAFMTAAVLPPCSPPPHEVPNAKADDEMELAGRPDERLLGNNGEKNKLPRLTCEVPGIGNTPALRPDKPCVVALFAG